METEINKGEKVRLYGFIGVCLLVIAAAYWFSNNDEPATVSGDVTTSDSSNDDKATIAADKPSFDVVRISRGGTGVIAGRATPGSIVEIKAGDKVLLTVTADQSGEWVALLEEPLEPGSAELTLTARHPNTADIVDSGSVVVVSVPARDEDRFVEREENGVVAVLSPRDGSGASRILQRPGGGFRDVDESLSVDLIDYGAGGNAIITGRALPRADVRVYLDGEFIGSQRVSDDFGWQMSFDPSKLTSSEHVIRIDQTIGDGDVQLRIEQPFTVGDAVNSSLAEGGVLVKPGNTLWHIARKLYGSGVRYTMIFKENSDSIRDPDLIYPGQVFKLPSTDR